MTNENKNIFLTIALGTMVIATILTVLVYSVFGESAGYFFMIVLGVPSGAISSLILMIIYNAVKAKSNE
ncbi:hypothetical protein OO007_19800 [Cocleimonas sp. KMM 6892]|uniref:hypothetical protein n=1 Tax=unclassified Cocleimonas TaxID=2639732 RepID=UPI002DB8FD49|nr:MULTISPECIES: hypothetical protein [unclassified Cocleimonas]MEB8434492.1 hypothetical protein [Cocleimonas sp. KMM 6892]MEC4717385.1 hypothetical protein [Cocleimonas sp. KMM 6895]MEC4746821.1 hypothetical protein [Cocleimonas sp. KMM 6896]